MPARRLDEVAALKAVESRKFRRKGRNLERTAVGEVFIEQKSFRHSMVAPTIKFARCRLLHRS